MSVDESLNPVFENQLEKMLLGLRDILMANNVKEFYFNNDEGKFICNTYRNIRFKYEWRHSKDFAVKGEVPVKRG